MPSLKYSLSLSALMFTNGGTAMDLVSKTVEQSCAGALRVLASRISCSQRLPRR
jgi:hypothetical protein